MSGDILTVLLTIGGLVILSVVARALPKHGNTGFT